MEKLDDEKHEIRYADLFGGVGGFRLGIERASNSGQVNDGVRWETENLQENCPNNNSENLQRTTTRCVFYNDIDKYAVQTYNKNFKENWKATDIRTIKTKDIPGIDMLCGGFPCQAFSIAGKRRGFQDTRGTLFFEIARIIKAKRPKLIFLENVKGLLNHEEGKTFSIILSTISELGYDVQWMVLNSKFFGVPQNRERVFIIGSLRGTSKPEILPFGRTEYQADGQHKETRQIIQVDDVARENKHKLGDRLKMDGATFTLNSIEQRGIIHNVYGGFGEGVRIKDLSPTIRTPKGGGHLPMVIQPAQLVNKNRAKKPYNPNNREMKIKVRDDETSYTVKSATHEFMVAISNKSPREFKWQTENSPTLQARDYKDQKLVMVGNQQIETEKRKYDVEPEKISEYLRIWLNKSGISKKQLSVKLRLPFTLVEHFFRKSVSISLPNKDAWLKLKEILGFDNTYDKEMTEYVSYITSKHQGNRVYNSESDSPTLNATIEPTIQHDMKIRRLTPIECERLQGFPDNWTEGVSDTQRYKQMGNAVTVNVIQAIARRILTCS